MIRRVAKTAFTLFQRTPKQLFLNTYKPIYSFSTREEVTATLKSLVQQQIAYEEEHKEDLQDLNNFFVNQGWTIKSSGIQIEFSKKSGDYNLRILCNARPPFEGSDNQREQQNPEEQEQSQDFTEISAFINKQGSSKWLAVEFLVTSSQQIQVSSASFITDYEFEKNERKKGRATLSGYSGPSISTLQEGLQDKIYDFIQRIGIAGQILQRASQLSVAFEHKFYLEWLKDLKSFT